jgi:hypothetical protein
MGAVNAISITNGFDASVRIRFSLKHARKCKKVKSGMKAYYTNAKTNKIEISKEKHQNENI